MTRKQTIKARKVLLEENASRIVSALKERYAPEKIIIFGSYVTGDITETSDLDILVVKKTRKNFYDRLREVATLCEYEVGADIIVYTPREFYDESKTNVFFKEEILKKGVVVYDRAA